MSAEPSRTGEPSIAFSSVPTDAVETERSCPDFDDDQEGTADVEVDFSYSVQTTTVRPTFLSDIETALLDSVADDVLTCNAILGAARALQEVVEIFSFEIPRSCLNFQHL